MAEPSLTFEQAVEELEAIIARLEAGGLPLEETLALFERGQTLAEQCNAALDQAQLRLDKARRAANHTVEVIPFDVTGE